MTKLPEVPQVQMNDGGYWENGEWHAPEGWPEGAGWVVTDADGTITQWGPASDLQLVATTDTTYGSLPPAADLGAALKGLPTPADGAE